MKLKMKIKLRRLFIIGIALKVIISSLLLGVFWELKRNADILAPTNQAAFNSLQKSISDLEDKVVSYTTKSQPAKGDPVKEELLSKDMATIKSVHHILNGITEGKTFDLAPLHEYVSPDELSNLSTMQEKISGTDESLRQELNLCLRYINTKNTEQSHTEKAMLEKMVKVEKTQTYQQDVQIHLAITNAANSLDHSHYDMALTYLNEMPENAAISSCIEGVKSAVQARITVKNILLSIQRRIIDDK